MKKAMIALAAVAVAAGVQAASFNWVSTAKAYSIASDTITAGLAAGTTYGVGSNNAASMYNQIDGQTASFSYVIALTAGAKSDSISGTFSTGDFSSRMFNVSGLSSSIFDGATGDNPVTASYSIIISGTIKDGSDKTWEVTANEITGNVTWAGTGDIKLTSATPTQWTVAPEPTSGLMLLLGVAGLALKRKRA